MRLLTTFLGFLLGARVLKLRALPSHLGRLLGAFVGLPLGTAEVGLPALARDVGFLGGTRLRLAQRPITVRIESCPPVLGVLLGPLHALVLGALELGLPTLESPLRLTLQTRLRLPECVLVRASPPHPPFGGASGTRTGWGRIGGKYTLMDMTDLRTAVIDVEKTRD